MKLLIEIPDNYKQRLDEDFDNLNTGSIGCTAILMAVKEGTPIPNNTTNGTAVETVFPDIEITEVDTYTGIVSVELDWWNAPYNAKPKAELNAETKAMLNGSFYNR